MVLEFGGTHAYEIVPLMERFAGRFGQVEELHSEAGLQVDHPEQFLLTSVQLRPAFNELQVTGVVAPDVNRSVPVLSLTGGRAVQIRTKLGDMVTKDQTLLVIDSPDLAQAFADYQKAQADATLAGQQLSRAQDLYGKGAIARAELEAAENAARKAQVDTHAAEQRLALLGADPNHPSPLVSIRAPISGSIVEQNVTSGTGVRSLDNSPNLFTIADLSKVWVLCDVYENDLGRVRVGDFAEVRLNAFPDRVFKGRVGNISTVLDPATRTARSAPGTGQSWRTAAVWHVRHGYPPRAQKQQLLPRDTHHCHPPPSRQGLGFCACGRKSFSPP